MTLSTSNDSPSWQDIRTEAKCLTRCFYFTESNSNISKVVTSVFVLGWVVVTIALTLEDVDSTRPVYYGIYTAIVFLILGRMWGIEIQRFMEE